MSADLPKPRSSAFVELRQRLGSLFERRALALIVSSGLDRDRMERLVHKLAGRAPGRQTPRIEIVARLLVAWEDTADGAWELVRELDRATRAERSLVASVPAERAAAELARHDMLDLRRHGAKLVWAIARDDRASVWPLAGKAAREYTERSERLERARREAERKGAGSEVGEIESVYEQRTARLAELESEIDAVERERARLAAEVGKREQELREETQQRRELAARLAALENATRHAPSVAPPAAPDSDELRRRLKQNEKRVRALEHELDALRPLALRVAELEDDNARLEQTLARLRELRAHERASRAAELPRLESEVSQATPVVESPRRQLARKRDDVVRVGLFVDVANLSGAARRLYSAAVDYRQLLVRLVGPRRLVEAHAYAIDKEAGFADFARALRDAGYRVHGKVPRAFDDGTVKADWDVSIAVDALSSRDKLDVVIFGTGDGDFVPAVAALKRAGLQVEAAAFRERTADELVRAVDHFFALDRTSLE